MHKFAQYMAVIDTIFFFFFTFRQTPEIKWKRIIGGTSKPVEELDDETRIKVTESGHELIISDLDYKDKGEYECSATNDITSVPVRGKFQLKVEGNIECLVFVIQ